MLHTRSMVFVAAVTVIIIVANFGLLFKLLSCL
jgi:hypothetical protein